mgnify:CR=1 FL=1
MSNQSLPPRANLPQIRNRAKDLVKAFRDRDARAVALTTTYLPRLNEATDDSLDGCGVLHFADAILQRIDRFPGILEVRRVAR